MKTLHLSIIVITTIILTSVILIPTFGEGPEWKTFHAMTGPDPSNPANPMQTFNIQYRIFNGTVDTFKVHDHYFIIDTHSKNNSLFEIKIPRNYPYYNGKDDPTSQETYLVMKNSALLPKSDYIKTVSDCFFTYSIPLYTNSTITIMSTDSEYLMTPIYGDQVPNYCMSQTMVIPEFPFAILVLLISTVSIIAFYRIMIRK